ncbi:MAG TPA: hypothetical protein PKD85_19855, partial [Saprospiraceae bacterium]|nr:hypothetical protein [Saprospiraceae bacterium]
MINYHDKKFAVTSNTHTGETSSATIFHYHQEGDIVWAEYKGGKIRLGMLIGLVNQEGQIHMRYQQINEHNQMMTGICISSPELLQDGRIRLHEEWQWTSGDFSKGLSVV